MVEPSVSDESSFSVDDFIQSVLNEDRLPISLSNWWNGSGRDASLLGYAFKAELL